MERKKGRKVGMQKVGCNGIFTPHGDGTGTNAGKCKYHVEMFTLVQNRGRKPGPIVSYCASFVPFTNPGLVPMQCELAITLLVTRVLLTYTVMTYYPVECEICFLKSTTHACIARSVYR